MVMVYFYVDLYVTYQIEVDGTIDDAIDYLAEEMGDNWDLYERIPDTNIWNYCCQHCHGFHVKLEITSGSPSL